MSPTNRSYNIGSGLLSVADNGRGSQAKDRGTMLWRETTKKKKKKKEVRGPQK